MRIQYRRGFVLLALAILILLAAPGCGTEMIVYPLTVIGDVQQVIEYDCSADLKPTMIGGTKHWAVALADVLDKAGAEDLHKLTFIGIDDHSATVEVADLTGSFLGWDDNKGWYFVSESYPINTHIKQIRQIIVQCENASGLAMIGIERNYQTITAGTFLSESHHLYIHEEGSTAREYEGSTYRGSSMSRHIVRPVNELVPGSAKVVKAVAKDGSIHNLSRDNYIEAWGNSFYLNRFDHSTRIALTGIIIDPPERMITDLYEDVLNLIDQNKQVLVVMLDGFSYQLYEKAVQEHLAPNLLAGANVEKAMSVFPPITPCGLAAMLTGQLPALNGIGSRDDRVLAIPCLLDALTERGKTGLIITGTVFPLQLEGEVILNADINSNQSSDDEVLVQALACLNEGYDLIFVHFKDLDRSGHTYGPLAEQTCRTLMKLDKYLRELYTAWPGSRILLTDHGMHQTNEGGHHGQFRYEDLIVPYIIYD